MLPHDLVIHPDFLMPLTIVFGLILGSFLNVAIYRLPMMLLREWQQQCELFLKIPPSQPEKLPPFNLCLPLSHCPHCQHPIPLWLNIPVLSYSLLRGKCHYCQHAIGWHYLLVELATAALSVLLVMHFGYTWVALAALIFSATLLVLTGIDIRHHLLPDTLTLSLLWLGLFFNLFHFFVPLNDAVIGALVGYLSLWVVAKLFIFFTKKEGLGQGDFKLFAALGAWAGWESLLLTLMIASFLGALVGIISIILKRQTRADPIPFGPFLALGGVISLLWGERLINFYLSYSFGVV